MSGMEFLKKVLQVLWGTYAYQGLFYMGLLVILCRSRSRWKKLVYSVYSIIVIVGLLNPITIIVAEKLWGTSIAYYCRLFSMIQIIVVIAYALVLLISRFSSLMKLLVVCCIIAVMFIGGSYVYSQDWFEKAENIEKIPDDVKIISEAFEKINDVTIAAPNSLTSYIRQYDASIHMITGRDDDSEIARQLDSDTPDVEYIMRAAGMEGAEFIVVHNREDVIGRFNENGYRAWYKSPNYYIYQVSGYERVKREYNDKEEIVSLTYLDAQGKLMLNSDGYAIVRYIYDDKDRMESEFYYGISEEKVSTAGGYYGCKFGYDKLNRVNEYTYLDENNNCIMTKSGYAIRTKKYNEDDYAILECYYDVDYKPVKIWTGYAGRAYEYNEKNQIIKITFLGLDKKPTIVSDGYVSEVIEYDQEGRVIKLQFVDEIGNIVETTYGYAVIEYYYDNQTNIERAIYYDINGVELQNK